VVLTAAPAYKCPAAPYEGAMLIDDSFRRQGLRDRVQIELYAAEPAPMGVAGPDVSTAVIQLLAAKGIPYHPEHQVAAVDADRNDSRLPTAARSISTCWRTCRHIERRRSSETVV
jgi:sulfide:quinone oxidoreductase